MTVNAINFVGPTDPILSKPAQAVMVDQLETKEMQTFLDQMITFAKGEQEDKEGSILVGLAAPQIGVDARIILVDVMADGKGEVAKLQAYINLRLSNFQKRWGLIMRDVFQPVPSVAG